MTDASMNMLLTTMLLAAITGLSIWRHLSGIKRSAASRRASGPRRTCPRCRADVPTAAISCPTCYVPLSAYQVITASVVTDETASATEGAQRLHGVVGADLCVGCGTCVEACPEPGAIALVGKQAAINIEACVGHGHCVAACPVGAIFMTTGGAGQRIEVPLLDRAFQSNVAGLYVVGELGGRGLIKNAINEGRIAIEQIASDLSRAGSFKDGRPDLFDVAIVGSGPAGISAGLEAMRLGLRYAVLERGTLADTIRKYPRHKILLAEPVKVPLYGQLWVADATKESLLKVWEAVIAETGLVVRTGHEVSGIEQRDGAFCLQAGEREFNARRVVLALGRRGTPRRLAVPGEDLAKVLYDIIEMESFAGRRVLVVGGGDSAVESAVGLSRQPGAVITLSYRGRTFPRIKQRNQIKLDEAVKAGRVCLILPSQIREIRHEEVVLDMAGEPLVLPNDDVIIRIGGEPPFEFLKRVGVRMVRKDVQIAGSWGKPLNAKAADAAAG